MDAQSRAVVASWPQAADPARRAALRQVERAIPQLDASFERLTRLLASLTHAPMAAFTLIDAEHQRIKAAHGLPAGDYPAIEGQFCRLCLARDDLFVVPDATRDPQFADNPLVTGPCKLRYYAGLPVREPGGAAVGTLCIIDQRPRRLNEADLAVLHDLRASIEELILLRTMSAFDALTGVHARGHFDRVLPGEWQRLRRAGEPLAALMIDVDHFKAYNDRHGHAEGDRCLRTVAGIIAEALNRGGDMVTRYGGEEFVVLLPNTGVEGAAAVAERIRSAVEQAALPHADDGRVVTVSLGSAVAEPGRNDGDSTVALLLRADQALYAAKHAGRNRHVAG